MQKITFLALVCVISAIWLPETAIAQGDEPEGKPLSGYYIGPGEEKIPLTGTQESAEGDEGAAAAASAIQNVPVIDDALAEKTMEMDPTDLIRVIIFLDYLPHDVIASQVRAKYGREINAIRQEVKDVHAEYTAQRRQDTLSDQENYSDALLDMSTDERETLRDINERNEALSLTMHREIAVTLNADIQRYQESVKTGIEQIGGMVEFGTTVGNAVIALVPAGALHEIAALRKVARVVADRRMEQDLNIAAAAAKVSDSGGLWANGEDGGIYDPAVLDSGTDLNHPGLEDDAGRENHWSWYLVSGSADPLYNDYSGIDDRNGHGTHVMGIVGSYGTTAYPNHLGMAHGAEKTVHLKAAFHRTDGRGSMYQTDAMWLVDRALYHQEQLYPTFGTDEFNDDVDGINLSYSGETDVDETDYSRFWDSVVSGYADTVVTLSAGNSGPSNAYFRSPACSYNAITVANVNDQNTADRSDDTIWPSSTRGPTENGRRKPDIAAPGTSISSCNTFWETQSDYVNKTGTSMATPMMQGLAMAMMDAGVLDEKEIKALLVNTAQKNEPGINFESDSDGWSEAYGWGYVNAWAAYYHRADVDSYTVTERDTTGDYILLSGQLRDEGSGGEGRDRVTMAWNRHATYNPHDYPTTYYNLSDLNLRLYREADDYLIDNDLTSRDNVHQVRINSGASATDVVVKAYAWSTDFAHGGATESFALATEEDFIEVDLPADFQAWGSYPAEMEPNEEREFEWWMDNKSDIASHSNQFDLVLPTGWTRVSGADPYLAGSVAVGGTATHATWILRAQATPQDGVHVNVDHTHNSYAEAWGPHRWYMPVNVRWDTTPPSPDPMTWTTEPYQLSTSQMRMVATTASDLHGPVAYHFWRDLSAGGASTDLGYHSSSTYTDSGLAVNTQYRYYVQARDNATSPNVTSWSSPSHEYTAIETPTGVTFGTRTSTSIQARSTNTPSGLTRGSSGLIIYNASAGTSSGWKQNNNWWTSSGLTPNTQYGFRARARNGDGDLSPYSGYAYLRTLAALPGTAAFSNITQTSIRANWTANGNPAGTEYYCGNTTQGTGSGWTTSASWTSSGLSCGQSYTFRVRARNTDGIATDWVSLGSRSTLPCDDDPPVIDDIDFDGCISELCRSAVSVTAHDPAGGTLTYAYTPLNDGDIDGSGADVAFNPPDSGPHPCPYRIEVEVTSSVSGLSDTEVIEITVHLAGDANGSGRVDILDKRLVRDAFGSVPGDPNWDPWADVNCSGRVDILDKRVVRDQYGNTGCACP